MALYVSLVVLLLLQPFLWSIAEAVNGFPLNPATAGYGQGLLVTADFDKDGLSHSFLIPLSL